MTDLNATFFTVLAVEDDDANYNYALCNGITWDNLLVSDTREALDSICAIMNREGISDVGEAFALSCAERGRLCFTQCDDDDGRYFENDYYDGFASFARGEALVDGLSEDFASGWNDAAERACAAAVAMVDARDALVDCTMLAIERACAVRRRFTPYV